MSRCHPTVLSLVLGAFLATIPLTRAQSPANAPDVTELQTTAYLAIMNGDKARDAEQYPEAIRAYQEALKGYQRIQQVDPTFKAKIIDYRLTYCTNQIKDIQGRMAKQENPELSSAKAALKDMQMRYQALESDAEALRRQSQGAREKEQAALVRIQQLEAAAAEAAQRANKAGEALRLLAEERARGEADAKRLDLDRESLLEAVKAAELKALALSQEAEALKADREKILADLNAKTSMESEQAKQVGGLREELEAARARVAEIESRWRTLGESPQAVLDRIEKMAALQTALQEESVRLAGENEKLRHDLAELEKVKTGAEAMNAERAEQEKRLAESMRQREELSGDLEKSRAELQSLRQALAAAQDLASGGNAAVSNANARAAAAEGELARVSGLNGELGVQLEEANREKQEVTRRTAASLEQHQAAVTASVRTIEENIAFVKSIQSENEQLRQHLQVSENLRAELEQIGKSAVETRGRLDAAEQAMQRAQMEIESLKRGIDDRNNMVGALQQGEEEFRKTIQDLRGALTEREKELQALKEDPARAGAGETAPGAADAAGPSRREPPLPREGEEPRKDRRKKAAPAEESAGEGL